MNDLYNLVDQTYNLTQVYTTGDLYCKEQISKNLSLNISEDSYSKSKPYFLSKKEGWNKVIFNDVKSKIKKYCKQYEKNCFDSTLDTINYLRNKK